MDIWKNTGALGRIKPKTREGNQKKLERGKLTTSKKSKEVVKGEHTDSGL